MSSDRHTDADATRESILDAAEDLFVDFGFDAVSMSKIANRAGVTKSLIHHHFGSKRELWEAAKLRGMAEYFEMQREMLLNREPTSALLEDSIVSYFRFLQTHPKVVRMIAWLRLEDEDEIMEGGIDLVQLGVERLQEGQRRGLIRSDIDPASMIVSFLGLVETYFHWSAAKCRSLSNFSDDEADDRYLDTVLKMYRAAVAAPAATEPES